jgi:vitellogenic carboxypeptidase-like protein
MKKIFLACLVIAFFGVIAETQETIKVGSNSYDFYTGYIMVNQTTNTSLFYSLSSAANKSLSAPNPLILWMQGGPGCSSLYGVWMEFGPWLVVVNGSNLTMQERDITWATYYHILTIDNPCTVGFNQRGTCNITSTQQAMVEVYYFLLSFFKAYPQLTNNPFYIFGESYGGKYIPYLAYEIITRGAKGFNFSGIGIGNAWTSPIVQLDVFARSTYSMGVIGQNFRDQLILYQTTGKANMINQQWINGTNMFNLVEDLLTDFNSTGGIFLNNYRDYSATEPIIVTYGLTQSFLNSTSTKQWFNVTPDFNYILCNGDVYVWWYPDFMQSVSDILSVVIQNTRVLLFNGADDIEVNTSGVLDFIGELSWPGIKKFQKAPKQIWNSTQGVLGTAKTYNNLTFVTVYKAGHMVPFYQPYSALDMVLRFINQDNNWSQPFPH